MKFDKTSQKNAWDSVEECTSKVRAGELAPALADWVKQQQVDLSRAVFPCIGEFDEGVYSGTLIADSRRVYDYFVDLDNPTEAEFDDVTPSLGPKEPRHPERDLCDLITMALVYYDEENRA